MAEIYKSMIRKVVFWIWFGCIEQQQSKRCMALLSHSCSSSLHEFLLELHFGTDNVFLFYFCINSFAIRWVRWHSMCDLFACACTIHIPPQIYSATFTRETWQTALFAMMCTLFECEEFSILSEIHCPNQNHTQTHRQMVKYASVFFAICSYCVCVCVFPPSGSVFH